MNLKKIYIFVMDPIKKVFFLLVMIFGLTMGANAQDKIVNPDISYAGTPRTVTIGGISVSGVEGYEDYVLAGISGLTVGQQITVPGNEVLPDASSRVAERTKVPNLSSR